MISYRLAAPVALAAVLLVAPGPAVRLEIAPWSGANLQTADAAAVRYRLVVRGEPGETVDLVAEGVTPGWIAAFCSDRVCSPHRVSATLPSGGVATLQFELIREENGAAAKGSARVSGAGAEVIVP